MPASQANPPLNKDNDFLLYNNPPFMQPDYENDVYPFLANQVMWATDYHEENQSGPDAVGAYDDAFVELEFFRLNVAPFAEAMADYGAFENLPRNPDNTVNCSLALNNQNLSRMSYWERLIVYADCHTDYHLLPQRDYGPVHLASYNFFDESTLLQGVPLYAAIPGINYLNQQTKECYMPNTGTLGYATSKPNWPLIHAHAFVAVGIWNYFQNYTRHKTDGGGNLVCRGDETVETYKIVRGITHELGHIIGRFTHDNQGNSNQCHNTQTVMNWYTNPNNAPFFCAAEIEELRKILSYPQD